MVDDDRSRRPLRIGISACLLGQQVRFDGGHKRDAFLTETFGRLVEWIPVCPEVECGLGTPREAMRLLRAERGPRLVTMKTAKDLTASMERFARSRVAALAAEDLSGYILKKDSPSCGLERVKVYDRHGAPTRDGPRPVRRGARRGVRSPAYRRRRAPDRSPLARQVRRACLRILEAARSVRRAVDVRRAGALSHRTQADGAGARA